MNDLTWIVPRHSRAYEVAPLLLAANDFAGIAVESILVYLDDTDHSTEPGVAKDFLFPGLFLSAPQVGSDTPENVRQTIQGRGTRHFVWLSKDLLDGAIEKTVWVYAHELRHVMQKSDTTLASLIAPLLARYQIEKGGQKFQNLDKPEELDSELFARRCLAAVFDPATLSHHIASEKSLPDASAYFQRLESIVAFFEEASNNSLESDAAKPRASD